MSPQTDQRLVLDLLETGKIDTSEAGWLLDRIGTPSSRRPSTPYSPNRNNKVVLEIDADEDNLEMVMSRISEAICSRRTSDKKPPLIKRLTRGKLPKVTIR